MALIPGCFFLCTILQCYLEWFCPGLLWKGHQHQHQHEQQHRHRHLVITKDIGFCFGRLPIHLGRRKGIAYTLIAI
eukprot:6480724-Amphidinium_carterae.2